MSNQEVGRWRCDKCGKTIVATGQCSLKFKGTGGFSGPCPWDCGAYINRGFRQIKPGEVWTNVRRVVVASCLGLGPVLAFAQTPDLAANLSACKNGRPSCESALLTPSQVTEVAAAGHTRNVWNCRNGLHPCDRTQLTRSGWLSPHLRIVGSKRTVGSSQARVKRAAAAPSGLAVANRPQLPKKPLQFR